MMLSFQMSVDLDFTMIMGCYVCGEAHKKLQILHFSSQHSLTPCQFLCGPA